MSWGYHTIFPPHKYTQDKADSPPPSRDEENNNAADNDADNIATEGNIEDDADVNADNNNAIQTMDNNKDAMGCRQWTMTQILMPPPRRWATAQTMTMQPQTLTAGQRQ